MHRALLICNSRYGVAMPELKGPRSDGPLLRHALANDEVGLFRDDDIAIHFDLTMAEILEETSLFFHHAEPGDTVLFYFSGHGRSDSESLYLCATNTDPARLAGTAVSNELISKMITLSSAAAKIVVLDCCEAGAWKGQTPERPENATFGRGSYLVGATTATQAAADAGAAGRPSPFTQALVDGLTYGAVSTHADGQVDLDDLFRYLKTRAGDRMDPYQRFEGIGRVPIARRPIVAARPAAAPEQVPFLDTTTTLTSADPSRMTRFRADLRSEIAARFPAELTHAEFLQKAQLLRDGRLTRAGALLFGAEPTAVIANALVQCRQIHGVTIDGLADDRAPLDGTLPEQISDARDFVAELARRGDQPTEDDARAQPYYEFPMITVREVIANAVAHRDYEQSESCVHVQFYADRVEVVSPGQWVGATLEPGERRPLGDLATRSRKRNFRLAGVLTWIKVMEGEGSGIPRALAECERLGAPEPEVGYAAGMVTVTIFPRDPDALPRQSDASQRQPDAPPIGNNSAFPLHSPVFYLSYSRRRLARLPVQPFQEANPDVVALFGDLSANVTELVGTPAGTDPGFMDVNLLGGEQWARRLFNAVGTCQVFVCLLSPAYLQSEWTAREWNAFAERTVVPRHPDGPGGAILPVVWTPVSGSLPPAIARIQRFEPTGLPEHIVDAYRTDGLLGLRRTHPDAYRAVVWRLSMAIARIAQATAVKPMRGGDYGRFPSTFDRPANE